MSNQDASVVTIGVSIEHLMHLPSKLCTFYDKGCALVAIDRCVVARLALVSIGSVAPPHKAICVETKHVSGASCFV